MASAATFRTGGLIGTAAHASARLSASPAPPYNQQLSPAAILAFGRARPGDAMSDLARYLDAATRPNTERAYAAAAQHFEGVWGGILPATPDGIARYLAAHAGTLSFNTLKLRLAGLARWHQAHGFADPTRQPLVKRGSKQACRLGRPF